LSAEQKKYLAVGPFSWVEGFFRWFYETDMGVNRHLEEVPFHLSKAQKKAGSESIRLFSLLTF